MADASIVTILNRKIINEKLKVYNDVFLEMQESFCFIKEQTILINFRRELENLSVSFNAQSDRTLIKLLLINVSTQAHHLSNYFYWCEYTAISKQFTKLGSFLREVEEWYRQIQHLYNRN